jgi:hypothetical protein
MNFFDIDLVPAYKNLKKEKEALESTVRVLSSSTITAESTTTENETNLNTKEVRTSLYLVNFIHFVNIEH